MTTNQNLKCSCCANTDEQYTQSLTFVLLFICLGTILTVGITLLIVYRKELFSTDEKGPKTCDIANELPFDSKLCTFDANMMCNDAVKFSETSGSCDITGHTQRIVKGAGVTPEQFLQSANNIFSLFSVKCVPKAYDITNTKCCKYTDNGPAFCTISPAGFTPSGLQLTPHATLCSCSSLSDCSNNRTCDLIDIGNTTINEDSQQCLGNTSYAFAGILAPTPCALEGGGT